MTIRLVPVTVALALGAGAADAAPWRFTLDGVLTEADTFGPAGEREALEGDTPFRFEATLREEDRLEGEVLDPTGVDLAATGFSAYAPLSATMTLGDGTYDVLRVSEDGRNGIGVALFDPSNAFNPGFWAAGILMDPLGGAGTGIVARFDDADPALDVSALAAGRFEDFLGAGYVSGTPDIPGPGAVCWPGGGGSCTVEPIAMTDPEGAPFELALASRPLDVEAGGSAFSAEIAAVPLPGGLALLASALGLGALARRRA